MNASWSRFAVSAERACSTALGSSRSMGDTLIAVGGEAALLSETEGLEETRSTGCEGPLTVMRRFLGEGWDGGDDAEDGIDRESGFCRGGAGWERD